MHIDEFEEHILTFFNNARHIQDFKDFINRLRNANEGFSAEITGPLITVWQTWECIRLTVV